MSRRGLVDQLQKIATDFNLSETASECSRSIKDVVVRDDEIVSPFVFMDLACRLILALAGGSSE